MKYASRYPMEKLMFANVYVRGKREEKTIFVGTCVAISTTFRSAQGGLLTRGLARPPASTHLVLLDQEQCSSGSDAQGHNLAAVWKIEGYFGSVSACLDSRQIWHNHQHVVCAYTCNLR